MTDDKESKTNPFDMPEKPEKKEEPVKEEKRGKVINLILRAANDVPDETA